MSAPAPPTDSFLNNPLLHTITGYIAHLQEQNVFSKERLFALKHHFLITIGFLVLLYCLIHIQILFFWLLKLIFRLLFKIISIIFWLPLKTVRFLIPKTIDYDILFPLFWLCSISSFYISKFSHENICQFYDRYLVQRYKIFNYDQTKREDIKRYLFVITFVVLLLLQSLFILLPIALSIRHHHHHHHQNNEVTSTPVKVTQTTTMKTATTKSAVKDVVETMSGNLYNRFIDAFKDENETSTKEKRAPLVSDEKLEDTFKTLQKTIKKKIDHLKLANNENEEKKSSRFQRWIVHYLKAPFQKWEKKTNEQVNTNIEQKNLEDDNEEEEKKYMELNSSSDAEEDDDEDDDASESDDDDDQEEHSTITEKIKNLGKNIKSKLSSSKNKNEEDSDEEEEEDEEGVAAKLSSSSTGNEEETDDESDEDEEESTIDKIKDKIAKPIEKVQNIAQTVRNQLKQQLSSSTTSDQDDEESGYDSDNEQEDEQSSKIAEKIKEALAKPIEKVKNVASDIKNKISSPTDTEDEDTDTDEESTPITDRIKERLAKPIETVKDLGEKVVTNVKNKLSSSVSTDEEESRIESEREEEEEEEDDDEEHKSILDRVKENIIKPVETAATNLRDKLPSLNKHEEDEDEDEEEEEEEEDLSFIDRTKQTAEKLITPIKDKISSNADELKHKATNLVDSAEELASNILEKSSEFLHEKTEQIKDTLPNTDQIKSKIKHQVVEPLEAKASKAKKVIKSKSEHLKTTVINKIKSLKKKKKPKTLTEKAKEKFQSLSKTLRDKLPGHGKKKKNLDKKFQLMNKLRSKVKLNGWFDDAWNIWHQAKTKLTHIFSSSTKHARHLPRYNTTSLYTAYTDLHCYDYRKKFNRYRLFKRKYIYFLDTYRHHSPFPVYLSVLKSNGPRCYRQYPNSTCGLVLKSSTRNFQTQLYHFVRFWAIIGILIVLLAVVYKNFTNRKQKNSTPFRPHEDNDRSSAKKQQPTVTTKNDLSKPTTTTTTTQRPSSIHQQTISSNNNNNNNSSPLNEEIEKQLQLWLEHEQNDGFRNVSETCRIAMNNTFLKQLERLSVETLQFANAKIRNVSQNNNNKSSDTPAEKIIINAILDIDHLILNIVNTFKEQHFSLEIQKLSGQLSVSLSINPNQYSIEANLQQLQINPVNIIDPNYALSANEKQSIVKLLDETIRRTIVRCSFRLSDNQENTNPNTLQNSSLAPYPDTPKTYSSSNQLSTSSIQSTTPRSRQPTPNRYQPSEPLPTVLINDTHQHLYTEELSSGNEPKRLLVRIVKAVKLHDVEQPYCILELNHPKQIQQTSVAKNGLNPFWDERFLFECDDKSNQMHLQIIDRKRPSKRTGNNYVDTVYADVSIPFSYITSTVYKQDVQISPQYPESIIRIEFSTLSEEEALAANNGYDVESLTDSQTWTYNERETNKIEHDYPQRYQQLPSSDFLSSSYDTNTLPKHYGLSSSLYDDERDYSATLPRSTALRSTPSPFSPSISLTPRDGGSSGNDKPHKSKSFMSSLKHLTLPRRKHRNKDKHENSMSSQASSVSQLNTSLQSPSTNPVSHSLSSALPGPYPGEYFLGHTTDPAPIRRSRSISQSFKNLFRSSSKKKGQAAKTDALGEFENVENRNYLSTSVPTTKKLSFLQRRKSKQKAKQQTNISTNSLSSYDCSRIESVRDTPVRANVGHPVTMTKTLVR